MTRASRKPATANRGLRKKDRPRKRVQRKTNRKRSPAQEPIAANSIGGGPLPDLQYHPFANVMPMMGAEDRAALKARMRREGYNKDKPLVLLDGMLLDGRNRYEIARELGLPGRDVSFRQFGKGGDGDDPLEFVLRENLDRRHLSTSQLALVIAELETLRHGGARKERDQDANLHLDIPRAELAARGRVSERTVATAAIVRDQGGPELKQAVRGGTVAISTAADIASLPMQDQAEIVARGEKEIVAKAKEIRARKQEVRHVERQRKGERIAANNPGLPGRLFGFVLIDLPRKHEVFDDATGSEKSPENHYPVMTFRELVDFPIDSFAAPDAILAFWSTAASLLDDLDILADWGFVALRPRGGDGKLVRDTDGEPLPPVGGGSYGSHQVWHKRRTGKATGMGRWFRDMHEMLILARRGDVPAPLPGTQALSCFDADWNGHSVKPHDDVRAWVDRCWPHMQKIEVFARGAAPKGWTFWGNQAADEYDAAQERGEVARIGDNLPIARNGGAR